MRDKNLRAEVKARVGALVHNGSGLRGGAAVAGVTPATVWAWQRGLRTPDGDSLDRLRALTS
jgi:hypothetical protein